MKMRSFAGIISSAIILTLVGCAERGMVTGNVEQYRSPDVVAAHTSPVARQSAASDTPTARTIEHDEATRPSSGNVAKPTGAEARLTDPGRSIGIGTSPPGSPDDIRAAVLHIGRASYQAEYSRNLLGVHITAESLLATIPLLEADRVSVVILEVNCQGGYWSEASKIQTIIEQEFMPRFRTVVWIHEAVSAAAMCMIAVPELYYQPAGVLGACPGWVHQSTPELTASDPTLRAMEAAAIRGGRAFEPIRSMLLAEPLSVRTRENGTVVWQQDESASRVLNRAGHVYTMNASDAVRYGFASGCCSDLTSLLGTLGLGRASLAGEAATLLLDESMAAARDDEVRVAELLSELRAAIRLADSAIEGPERTLQVEQALATLAQLRAIMSKNTTYARFFAGDANVPAGVGGLNNIWFDAILHGLDRLRRKVFPLDEVAEGEMG